MRITRWLGAAWAIVWTLTAVARPEGLPVEMLETFDRLTPGVGAAAQPRTLGCALFQDSALASLRPGSASDVAIINLRANGTSGGVRMLFPFRLFADATHDASAQAELFTSSLAASTSFRFLGTGGSGTRFGLLQWGGPTTLLWECGGSPVFGGPSPNFISTEPCLTPGDITRFKDTGAAAPTAAWFRLEMRCAMDGTLTWYLDRLDGSPAEPITSFVSPPVDVPFDTIIFDGTGGSSASRSYMDNLRLAGVSRQPTCPGDATRDGLVNFADLNEVLGSYGQTSATTLQPDDVDGDGTVGFEDLNLVLSSFGGVCRCRP